jgi:glycosyltransferase involved in cell wall biosynthesis
MNISIITTVKNNPLGIIPTIKNIINQSIFKNIEYIIVDASTEKKTPLIIKSLIKNKNIKYIKTNDKNFYKGINLGIRISKGKYVGILNSGDIYYSNNILKQVSKIIEKKPTVNLIFGNLFYYNALNIVREWNIKSKSEKINPFKIAHPTTFIAKKVLVKNNYYSEDFNISSDIDFLLRSKNDFEFNNIYINDYIIFMKEGGLSTNIIKLPVKIFEDLSILFSHFSLFFLFFYLKKILIKVPGYFLLEDKKKHYKVLLDRFLEISKKKLK